MAERYYTEEDLTIVICAYKTCASLERSIRSILRQTARPRILIATSTPNEFIGGLSQKYHIPLRVNPVGGHVNDYNFALNQVTTHLGMIAHQDDILHPHFVKKSLDALNQASSPILSFTNYLEIVDDKVNKHASGLVLIKRCLVWPMCVPILRRTVFMKRLGQCLGNPITHPTVICVMKKMPLEIFRVGYQASMDWDLWERLSREPGEFVYVKDVLLYHRMSKENATAKLLSQTNVRYEEELDILSRFWPKWIAKRIMIAYSKSAKYY